jgi:hypothetical protein
MRNLRITVGVLATLAFITATAGAEQFGDNGTVAIGVDRMFGYVSYTYQYDTTGTTGVTPVTTTTSHESTTSNFSLLGRALGYTVMQVPRLSIDVALGPGVTLGGSIMYDHYSTTNKTAGQESPDKPSTGVWLLSPRVGFAKMFTPQFGIWPRAGILYVHSSNSSSYPDATGATITSTNSMSSLYFTLDANLILMPVSHFGFTLGPTVDYSLSHSTSSSPPALVSQTNEKDHAIGVQAGIFAWF